MEQTFYTLEQELLKPVYAIYPWSPMAGPASAPVAEQRGASSRPCSPLRLATLARTPIGCSDRQHRNGNPMLPNLGRQVADRVRQRPRTR